eukprot:jgi/Bigna1/90648/estExt_fgenesh1_pg.C_750076
MNKPQELAKKVVLCVGAGGLGCEILKNLALSGIKNIVVIDLDTIDLSNLNRQFLFRKKDVGKAKAQVAAEFIKKRCKGVNITWHCQKIQEFDDQFYRQFDIVIAGLDNVKARLWLNSKLYSLIEFDEDGEADPDTIIPLVDGGSEGFKVGQARVFLYPFYSCFECSAADVKEGPKFELCTIRNTPRIAEHCIAYALILLWPRLKSLKSHKEYEMVQKKKSTRKKKELCGDDSKSMEVEEEEEEEGDTASDSKMLPNGVKLDKDNPEHMTWVYERAKERANEFNIEGVTYNLTMQFVKNIIPAIASTNALISAACTNEAIKYLMFSAPIMDGYFYYNGQGGAYSRTFAYEKNPDCFTCGSHNLNVALKAAEGTIGDLKQDLENKYKLEIKAFFTTESKTLWNRFSGAEALNTKLSEAIPKTDAKIIMMAKNDGAAKPSKFTLNIRFE